MAARRIAKTSTTTAPAPIPTNGLTKVLHEAQREPGPTFAEQLVKLAFIRGWKVIRLKGAAEVLHGPDSSGLPVFMMLRGSDAALVWLNGSKRAASGPEYDWGGVFTRTYKFKLFDWGPEDVKEIEEYLTDG